MTQKKIYLSIGIIVIISFFLCYPNNKSYSFQESDNNTTIAIYEENQKVNQIPKKESGYYFDREKSKCNNNTRIEWDSETWSPVIERVEGEQNTRLSCEIHFTQTYHEGILNGMDPVIKDSLIPVTIDDKGTVKKADLNEPWYSYADKQWANSVILQNSYDSLNAYGNIYGATKSDGYVSLDGQDDYIDLGLTNYDFKNQITLVIHFKFQDNLNTWQNIFGNWESAGGGMDCSDHVTHCNAGLHIAGSYRTIYFNLSNIHDYHTILLRYDGQKGDLWVDGQQTGNTIEIVGNITPSNMPIIIGANPEANNTRSANSNIAVKQAAIFDRAITEEEISKMTEDIKITNSEGLLKYVDFTNKKSEDYEPKEVIPEDVIESYFVWIPKYRYQLFNLGNYSGVTDLGNITSSASVPNNNQEIKIKFGDYNTVDGYKECVTPPTSNNGNCKVGDYMTHPAFTAFENSTGFWVGKFETGYEGAKSTSEAQINKEDTSKVIIKPNVYSWRNIQVANAHLNSYNYQRENLDSHMMKNSEWGAVAYLTNSRYGRCNGVTCEEVRINNSQNYVTGASSKNVPTCGWTNSNETCNHYEDASLTVSKKGSGHVLQHVNPSRI